MGKLKAYCAAISAQKIHFVLKPGAARFVEQEPTDLEEAAPQGGEVTFLYRSGKNRLLVIFAQDDGFESFLVYRENGEREQAALEGRYASFEVDLQHAPKEVCFALKGESPRFLTLAFSPIPGRRETLKALAPKIQDLNNSFILTFKNGSEKVSRTEIQLYKRQPHLTQPHTWNNHTYVQSFFPTTNEIMIPHDSNPCLSFRFRQSDAAGNLLFDSGFLNPLFNSEVEDLILYLEVERLFN
jgi:hypothetical protein